MYMTQLRILLRIQMQAVLRRFAVGFAGNNEKTGKTGKKIGVVGMVILYALLVASLFLTFGMMFFVLADAFHAVGLGWLYMTFVFLATAMFMLIGTVFLAKSQLFEAKDNAILLPMPIPPSIVLLSRMLSLYLMNLIWGGVVLLPALVCNYLAAPFRLLPFLCTVVLFLALALLTLALSCLLGWLIALVSARIRNKTFVTVVLALAFIGVYYYFCGTGMTSLLTMLTEQVDLVADTLGAIAPLFWLGDAAVNGTPASFLYTLLLCVLPFAAVYALLERTFIKTVTASHSTKKITNTQNASQMRANGVRHALLARENAHLLSSATYLLNAGVGLVFLLVGAVAIVWELDTLGMSLALFGWELLPAMFISVACMMLSMTIFTAPSVSLEAKTLPILRALPLHTYDILRAKWQLHLLWCVSPTLLFSLVGAVFFLFGQTSPDTAALLSAGMTEADILAMFSEGSLGVFDRIVGVISILLLPQLFSIVTGGIGLLSGIRFANLNWTNEAQVIKQGTAVAISMFGNMGLLAASAALVWFGQRILPVSVLLLLLCAVFTIAAFVIRHLLKTWGVRAFEAL